MTTTPDEMQEPPDRRRPGPEKRSRAAEYIAALYIALLVCAPWLLREASLLTPPSRGVEMQMSNRFAAPPAPALKAAAQAPAARALPIISR